MSTEPGVFIQTKVAGEQQATAALNRLETGLVGVEAASAAASAAAKQYATDIGLMSNNTKSLEKQQRLAAMQSANLGYQFNDIGVMLAAGQSPLMLAVQQGTQINQVFQQMGGTANRIFPALRAGLVSVINPLSLLTIGTIAAAGYLVQFARQMWGAESAAAALSKTLPEVTKNADKYIKLLNASNDMDAKAFKAARKELEKTSQTYKDLIELAKTEALLSINATASSLRALATDQSWGIIQGNIADAGDLLAIDTGLNGNITLWKEARNTVSEFVAELQRMESASSIAAQYDAAIKIRDAFKQTVDITGDMTGEQLEFITGLSEIIAKMELILAATATQADAESSAINRSRQAYKLYHFTRMQGSKDEKEAQARTLKLHAQQLQLYAHTRTFEARRILAARELFRLTLQRNAKIADEDDLMALPLNKAYEQKTIQEALTRAAGQTRMQLAAEDAVMGQVVEKSREMVALEAEKTAERLASTVFMSKEDDVMGQLVEKSAAMLRLEELVTAQKAREVALADKLYVSAEETLMSMELVANSSYSVATSLAEAAINAGLLNAADIESGITAAQLAAVELALQLNLSYKEALKLRAVYDDPIGAFGGAGEFVPEDSPSWEQQDEDAKKKKGGGRKSPLEKTEEDYERLRESFLLEEEIQREAYARQQEIINEARAAELIGDAEHKRMLEEAARRHADAMIQIDAFKHGSMLDKTGAFFGALAVATSNGSEKMLKISKAAAAAEALISTYKGAAKELELGTFGFATAALVIAKGMAFVAAIKGAGTGAGGAASAAAVPQEQQAVAAPVLDRSLTLIGDSFSRKQALQMAKFLNQGSENGLRIRGAA